MKLPPTISSAHLTGEGVKCVKAWGVVKNDHQTVFDLIWNEELATKKKDDDTLLDFKIPFQYGENDQIIYSTYRLPFPLSNREFVFVRSIRKDGDTLYNVFYLIFNLFPTNIYNNIVVQMFSKK